MAEQDTVELLRECDAGVKMGVASIREVLEHTRADDLRSRLTDCLSEHEKLKNEIAGQLRSRRGEEKETNAKLAMDSSDATIAELMTDGCNMGVKSLNRYLNQYKAADEVSKDIAKRLINLEEELTVDIRSFL